MPNAEYRILLASQCLIRNANITTANVLMSSRKIRKAIHLVSDLLKPLNSMFGYRRRKTQASASGRVTPNLEKDLKIFYNTWSATHD